MCPALCAKATPEVAIHTTNAAMIRSGGGIEILRCNVSLLVVSFITCTPRRDAA